MIQPFGGGDRSYRLPPSNTRLVRPNFRFRSSFGCHLAEVKTTFGGKFRAAIDIFGALSDERQSVILPRPR